MSGLLTAGGITAGLQLVAHANTAGICASSGTTTITCSLTNETIVTPTAIQAGVTLSTTSAAQYVGITYSMVCQPGSVTTTNTTAPALPVDQAINPGGTVTDNLVLGVATPDRCTVSDVTAELYTDTAAKVPSTAGSFRMILTWTPGGSTPTASASSSAPPPPPPAHVSQIKGYGGKCMDDSRNSSRNGTKLVIWSCNSSDHAQQWTYSGGELKHNGKCANDAGNGGSGTKLILWTCNGGANEKWFHSSTNGEFILNLTTHGLLCLTDPGYSKTNGTQLTVATCHNTSNQHWHS